jgi:hypothetical protein
MCPALLAFIAFENRAVGKKSFSPICPCAKDIAEFGGGYCIFALFCSRFWA